MGRSRSRSYSKDRKRKDRKKDKKSRKYSKSQERKKDRKRSRSKDRKKDHKRDNRDREYYKEDNRDSYKINSYRDSYRDRDSDRYRDRDSDRYRDRDSDRYRNRRSPDRKKRSKEKENLTEEEIQRKKQMRLVKAKLLQWQKDDSDAEEDKKQGEEKGKSDVIKQVEEDMKKKEEEERVKQENLFQNTRKEKITIMLDSDGLEDDDSNEVEDIPVMIKKEAFEGQDIKSGPKPIPDATQTNGAMEEEEEDPFDAFMADLEKDAVRQEGMDYAYEKKELENGEEDFEGNGEVQYDMDKRQIITLDDILGNSKNNQQPQHPTKIEEEDEDDNFLNNNNNNNNNKKQNGLNGIKKIQFAIKKEAMEEEDENGFDFTKGKIEQEQEDEEDKYLEEFRKQMKQKHEDDRKDVFIIDDNESDGDEFEKQLLQGEKEGDDYFSKKKKLTEKKDLKQVDHMAVDYIRFRKNFYIEPKEIRDMTKEQVEDYRKMLGDIQIKGDSIDERVPRPAKNWYQCGLSELQLQLLIKKKKYLQPFPIQCQCVPVIMSGLDTIGVAETGSGKTLAYILPMLRHILDQPPLREGDGPVGLIMVPTRELAIQIYDECKSFAKPLGLNTVCVYGGAGIQGQLSELKKGCEIVVCTPARFIDVLATSNGKITNTRRVSYVVIDEADRMLDNGFEPQIVKILTNTRADRQTVMFSATFPKNVEILAKNLMDKPVEIVVGAKGQACTNIEQFIEVRTEDSKILRLLEVLGEWQDKGAVIIFVVKKTDADILFKELIKFGYFSIVLHGDMDPEDRQFAIYDFKKGVRNIMVATSLCARGLDHKDIKLVVNYDCPNHMEDYIHRIGRTGRAGQKGTAITFITEEEDKYASDMIKVLQMSSQKVPKDLQQLHKGFIEKVTRGEAKIYQNNNRQGTGYQFSEEEQKTLDATRKALKKRFGMENNLSDDSSDEEDIFNKVSEKKKETKTKEKTNKEKLAMIKDPHIKKEIMDKGIEAAKLKILNGASQAEIAQAAQEAITKAINDRKSELKNISQGTQQAADMFKDFIAEAQEDQNIVTADFEINDYPQNARQKVCGREFIGQIYDLTSAVVTIRGTLFEPGKKVPIGQMKQFLHIEGDNKNSVQTAYQEIKRVIEEAAQKNLTLNLGK